jgi:hypothetical protein
MHRMKQKPTSGLEKERGQSCGVDGSASRGEPEQVAEPDEPKSRYSIEECRRFAEWGFRNGSVSNPVNYARAIQRSGCVDSSIERFLWEEKLRLDSERELAAIQMQHKREVEELEKAVGQAMRAWAAERAARVRESAFGGTVFVFSLVMFCAALWVGLGPLAVERWRRWEAGHATRSGANDFGDHTVPPVPSTSAGKGQAHR